MKYNIILFLIILTSCSSEKENLIIDYMEENSEYRQLKELKNTFGHLELQMHTLKRKSILRRRITSDLLKKEIETLTKTMPGNHLFFINPNPMEETEFSSEKESRTIDNTAPETSKSQ